MKKAKAKLGRVILERGCEGFPILDFGKSILYYKGVMDALLKSARMRSFMGNKTMVCLLTALLLLSLGLTSVPKSYSQVQDVKVLNYTYYIDPEGILDVIGEVQNVGPNVISLVYLTGTVYGGKLGGTDLDDSACYAWAADLLPQQKAPFYMEFYEPQTGVSKYWDAAVAYYPYVTVATANATTSYEYPYLSITSSTGKLGTSGNFTDVYYVDGVIKNTGNQAASDLTVVATFYNSTGSIVAVGNTLDTLTSTTLEPSQTTTFMVPAFDLNQSQVPANWKIHNYALNVQAQEPILQGTPPSVTPSQGTSTSPSETSTPSQTAQSSANNNSSFFTKVAIVAAAVVILAVAAVAALLVLRRSKPPQTVKEVKKARKQRQP
jgi:hypothetical protein